MILRTGTYAIKVSLLVILGYDNCTWLLYRFLNQFNGTIDGFKNKWVLRCIVTFFLYQVGGRYRHAVFSCFSLKFILYCWFLWEVIFSGWCTFCCSFYVMFVYLKLVLGAGFHVKKVGFLFMEPLYCKQRSPIFIKEYSCGNPIANWIYFLYEDSSTIADTNKFTRLLFWFAWWRE